MNLSYVIKKARFDGRFGDGFFLFFTDQVIKDKYSFSNFDFFITFIFLATYLTYKIIHVLFENYQKF